MHNKHGGSLRMEHRASPSKTLGVIWALWGLSPSGFPPGRVFNSVSYNKQRFFSHKDGNEFGILSGGDVMDFPTPSNRPMEELISNITSGWTVTGLASISKILSAFLNCDYVFLPQVFLLRNFNILPNPSSSNELNKIFWHLYLLQLCTSHDYYYFLNCLLTSHDYYYFLNCLLTSS